MNTKMRSISVIALVSAMVLFAVVAVAPVMAQPSTTPYVINGYVFYADGSECKGPVVSVTNTPAENDTNSNYYELVLDSSKVSAGDVLRFNARDPGGTQENVTDHTVTQAELDNGGLFDFNITLHPVAEKIQATVSITPETLNMKSNGEWVTASIGLPEGYDVANINESTVSLDCTHGCNVSADTGSWGDGVFKFNRTAVTACLDTTDYDGDTGTGEIVELLVTGELIDGTQFEGSDTVRVIKRGK